MFFVLEVDGEICAQRLNNTTKVMRILFISKFFFCVDSHIFFRNMEKIFGYQYRIVYLCGIK